MKKPIKHNRPHNSGKKEPLSAIEFRYPASESSQIIAKSRIEQAVLECAKMKIEADRRVKTRLKSNACEI